MVERMSVRKAVGVAGWLVLFALVVAGGPPAMAATKNPSPCSLLSADDVAAVLGPLAGPPFPSDGYAPVGDRNVCRYVAKDLRSLTVRVEWKDGDEEMTGLTVGQGMVAKASGGMTLMLPNGVSIAGEWDDARMVGCCEFNALRGEQLIAIDFTAARTTIEAIAKLADKAIGRLDDALAVDDAAAMAAAKILLADLPKARPVCDLVTADEAKAVLGRPLFGPTTGDEQNCTFRWQSDSGLEYEMTLAVQWHDGFRTMGKEQSETGIADAALTELAGEALKTAEGPWDAMAETMIGVMAVKRDVLFSVETGGVDNDIATGLIRAAANKF